MRTEDIPKKILGAAKGYFEIYPLKKMLWATADGNFFIEKCHAVNHAKAAKIDWYEITRDTTDVKTEGDAEKEKADRKEKALAEIRLIADPATADYSVMKNLLLAALEHPRSWKKEDVIEAIINLKSN